MPDTTRTTRTPQPDPAPRDMDGGQRETVERELNRKPNKENPPRETRDEKPHAPSAASRPPDPDDPFC